MQWLEAAAHYNPYLDSSQGLLGEKDPAALFDALLRRQGGLETLANQFLQTGIDHYLKKDYAAAVKPFSAAISLAPQGSYNAEASQYLVQTHLKLEEPDKAVAVYHQAIQRNPQRDDLRAGLGQLYFAEGRYAESVQHYRAAVQINPGATNRYAFGEALLKVGNTSEAEYQFREVGRLDPRSHAGDYGLGKLYAQTGRYDRAIEYFENALARKPDFHDALAEIGYVHADAGEIDKARAVARRLAPLDPALGRTLELFIDEREPPRIAFALAAGSFPHMMSKGTAVAAIDAYLQNAGARASVSMQFRFSKQMDPAGVENRFNWTISRAVSHNLAHTYHFGDAIPASEVAIEPYPDYVIYNADARTATVGFSVRQNQSADGTIDPSHIVFKFAGQDRFGVSMDRQGDEYSGFSGSV
ncbi:MAG TPA: tetratricopeptide repeat protein [Desulfobacterales bacterium]|nr:tetratricopeptide repeat protein [Desulfobacterales bacterium]